MYSLNCDFHSHVQEIRWRELDYVEQKIYVYLTSYNYGGNVVAGKNMADFPKMRQIQPAIF